MNREEILAKSRSENEKEDEMEKMVKLKAASISRSVGFVLCSVIALLDAIFGDFRFIAPVCWLVYWGMQSTEEWILWAQLKKKRSIFLVLLSTVFTLLFATILIWNVFAS